MSKEINVEDRDILSFKPNIYYIEPDQQPGEIDPVTPDQIQIEDYQEQRRQVKQLAKAVNTLATAVQAKVDDKAKNMKIKLDPKVDQATIQAMRRRFPDANPTEITYQQYRECKDKQLEKGLNLGMQPMTTLDDVLNLANTEGVGVGPGGENYIKFSGYGTPEAEDGRLRPELNPKGQIIEPIDIEEFQADAACLLVNFLWKNLIKPIIPLPGLPDKLCGEPDMGPAIAAGAPVLDKQESKKQESPEIPEDFELEI